MRNANRLKNSQAAACGKLKIHKIAVGHRWHRHRISSRQRTRHRSELCRLSSCPPAVSTPLSPLPSPCLPAPCIATSLCCCCCSVATIELCCFLASARWQLTSCNCRCCCCRCHRRCNPLKVFASLHPYRHSRLLCILYIAAAAKRFA